MYTVLDKDMIELEMVPYLPIRKRGFSPTVPLVVIVNAILYKLKTCVQWRQLPVKALFENQILSWQSVYYHYRKWCATEALENCWIEFLKRYKSSFDLSSVDLDGSHSPAIRLGASVEYEVRKKRKTTNALYPTNSQGLPLAMSEPLSGNHNDLYIVDLYPICVYSSKTR